MYTVLLFSLLGAAASFTVIKREQEIIRDEGWHTWKSSHSKTYSHFEEEKVRFAIWKDNFERIVEHNARSSNVILKMNKFGDLTNTEFKEKMNGYSGKKASGSTFLPPSNLKVPASVDWRTKGMVTPVKDQKQCGSCWAFSTTGSLEGQHQKKTGKLVSLSEQQLVDCSRHFGNEGCDGGLMDYAFAYIKANKGIDSEASYPYTGEDGQCAFNKSAVAATVTGFVDVKSGDEDALMQASAAIGPISVGIDASHFSFQFYSEGVYDEDRCSSEALDHGVLVVGYGTSPKGIKYWLVKNSWNTDWGLDGYIWMSRDKHNQCGIATQASYPLV